MKRGLRLRKETLAELAPAELAELGDVVGGTSAGCVTFTLLLTGCMCSGMWPSLNVDCATGRVCA